MTERGVMIAVAMADVIVHNVMLWAMILLPIFAMAWIILRRG
jgi:hypothetical protein